jgi:hypothetical protein
MIICAWDLPFCGTGNKNIRYHISAEKEKLLSTNRSKTEIFCVFNNYRKCEIRLFVKRYTVASWLGRDFLANPFIFA